MIQKKILWLSSGFFTVDRALAQISAFWGVCDDSLLYYLVLISRPHDPFAFAENMRSCFFWREETDLGRRHSIWKPSHLLCRCSFFKDVHFEVWQTMVHTNGDHHKSFGHAKERLSNSSRKVNLIGLPSI